MASELDTDDAPGYGNGRSGLLHREQQQRYLVGKPLS
jgi:hypothetical protein